MTSETNQPGENGPAVPEKSAKTRRAIPVIPIINILLFCGLLALYALHFFTMDGKSDQSQELTEIKEKVAEAGVSIAYVNSDRLLEEYELALKMRDDFIREQSRLESDLTRRQRTFQSDIEDFQRSINAGTISIDRAEQREKELMVVQQELMQLSDTYRERLGRQEFDMNLELLNKISDFLERYNKEMGYDFILGYTRGGGILHAEASHDITQQVLSRLNAEFRSSQ